MLLPGSDAGGDVDVDMVVEVRSVLACVQVTMSAIEISHVQPRPMLVASPDDMVIQDYIFLRFLPQQRSKRS